MSFKLKSLIFFITLLLPSRFLNFFHYDEALIYLRTQNLHNLNSFDLIDKFESQSFGRFFYLIFSKLENLDEIYSNYFYLRIFSLASVILILIIGNNLIKNYFEKQSKYLFIFNFIIILWFAFFSGGITSRYDAILSFTFFYCLKNLLLNLHL